MRKILIDADKCSPELCEGGVCAARKKCPVKAVFQMERYDTPAVDWSRCRGCGVCLLDCPTRAVELVDN